MGGFNSYTGVNVPFTADNKKFVAAMTEARGSVGKLQAEMSIGLTNSFSQLDYMQRRLNTGIGRTADLLKTFGSNLTNYVTVPMALIGAGSMQKYFEMDALAKGLDVITKSTQVTGKYLNQFLEDAKMPGVGYQELVEHGTRWLILGDNITTARKKMLEFGNALALEGKGKAIFDTINFQLIQMANKGKVIAEDLKPILNASSVISKVISDRYKSTDSGDIQAQLEKNGVGSKEFINTLVNDLSRLDRVAAGAKNSFENFTDSIFIGAAGFGEWIDKGIGFSGIMDAVGDAFRSFATYLKDMDPAMREVLATTLLLGVAAGPVLNMFGGLLKVFTNFTAISQIASVAIGGLSAVMGVLNSAVIAFFTFVGFNPFAAVAIGAFALAGALVVLAANYDGLTDAEKRANAAQEEVNKTKARAKDDAEVEIQQLDRLVKIVNNKATGDIERGNAIKQINQLAPEYLGNITAENIGLAETVTQLKNYKIYIKEKIIYDALNTQFQSAYRKTLEAKDNLIDKNQKPGAMDWLSGAWGGGRPEDVMKRRLASDLADATTLSNRYFNELDKQFDKMNGAGGELNYTPQTNTGGGKIETTKQRLARLNAEMRETSKNLDDLERKIEAWDKENGIKKWVKPDPMDFANGTGGQFGSFKPGLQGFTKEGISAWGDGMIGKFKVPEIKSNLTDLSDTYRNGLQNIAGGITDGLSQMASAWVDGTFKWQSAGAEFTGLLGQMMVTLGQSFVTMGIAKLAADLLATSTLGGGALIAIGAGLQVAGGAVKGQANKWGKGGQLGGSAGSVGSYSSPTYSGTSSGYGGGANAPLKIDLNLTGNFRIAGSDLVLAISRQTTLNANR